jgi:hypothetical protein
MNKLNSLKIKYLFGMFFLQTCSLQSIFRLLIIGFSIFILFSSCRESNGRNENPIVEYSIDTVLIDSKGHLLNMNGVMASDLDHGDSMFYMFNMFDHSINELNLNSKEYVKSFKFEVEGPNGVGEYVFGVQFLDDSLFFLKSNSSSSIVNRDGLVVGKIGWERAKLSAEDSIEFLPRYYEYLVNAKDPICFGLSLDLTNQKAFLDVMNSSENTITRHDVDPKKSFHDFFFRFDDQVNFVNPVVFFQNTKNYICISHEFSNEIILYNHKGDFVKTVEYVPKLTPKRAKKSIGSTYQAQDEIRVEFQSIYEQVKYEYPVYDKLNDRYFRISKKRVFTDVYENEHSLAPVTKDVRVFVSVFDHEFNLVSEFEVSELKNEGLKYFAKDGKLWVSQNFSDELGFIVVDYPD